MNHCNKKFNNLFYIPLPPPYAGPEFVSQYLWDAYSRKHRDAICLNATLRASNNEKGKIDLKGIWGTLKLYGKFVHALIRHRPRVVYLLFSSARMAFLRDAVNIMTAKAFGCKVVGHYHGGNFHRFFEAQSPRWQQLIRSVLRKIDTIIVLGKNLRPMFQQIDPSLNLAVLYNGLPPAQFVFAEKRNEDKDVKLFFMGHLTFAKGFYDLVAAYKKLRTKYPFLRLHIAGTPHGQEHAGQIASFLSGKNKTFYLDNLEMVHREIDEMVLSPDKFGAMNHGVLDFAGKLEVFAKADVVILPSYTEGFSMSMLEAMFMGKPVVVSNVGALPEVVHDGENGFVIEPGDVEALQDRLARLIESPELRCKIGQTNAMAARERFSIERMADDLNCIFKKTVSNRKKHSENEFALSQHISA
ncbi:glycosyltransferase family 4 protein [candidate division KSB1 bacterium]|nr:glycosyltransferase family 4 protein [candidate division KSB1 bacterium]